MSEETRELAERLLEAYCGSEGPDFDATDALIADDFTWIPAGGLDGGELLGKGNYRGWLSEINEVMPFWSEAHGVVDCGPGKALAVISAHFRSSTGNVGSVQRMWILLTVRDGKVQRSEAFTDPQAALEAALQ